jgi:proline iminopeptidase
MLLPACALAQTTGYASSNGVDLYFHTYGEGAPLLVLNGGPGLSSQHFGGLAQQLADLGPGYQVILFDQRGTGHSTLEQTNGETVNIALMIEDIEALRRHLGFETWTVFGHSWGGMYAMLYATTHADKVTSLILSASGGSTLEWLAYTQANIRMAMGPERRARFEQALDPTYTAADPDRANRERVEAMAAAYVYHPEHIPFVVEALTRPGANFPAVRSLVYADLRRIGYDLREELSQFNPPALILHGRQDLLGEMVPLQTHEALPHSELVWVNECSHYLWLDQPETYFDAIERFLANIY